MPDTLVLTTEQNHITLRELSTLSDDKAYFEGVNEDRAHLSRYGDATASKYQTLEDVTDARLNAGDKLRLGIWVDDNYFVGSINATPNIDETEAEIGLWLRSSATGHGYATVAVKALAGLLTSQYSRVFAEVHENNIPSRKVMKRAGLHEVGQVQRKWGKAIVFEAMKEFQTLPAMAPQA